MVKHGELSEAEYKKLHGKRRCRCASAASWSRAGNAGHFVAWLRKWLIDWADRNDYDLYADGLMVQTTLDSALQEAATQAVARQMAALQTIADVEWGMNSAGLISGAPSAYARHAPAHRTVRIFLECAPAAGRRLHPRNAGV